MSIGSAALTAATRGAYPADRAAALAGVPRSTLYYWARHDILTPTVSKTKVKLWSWADLIVLRAVYWLRSRKPDDAAPATTMSKVRQFLTAVEREYGDHLGTALAGKALLLRVDSSGDIYFSVESGELRLMVSTDASQVVAPDLVDLLAEFDTDEGTRGPHLITPRPRLRILPGKLGGEPHVQNTRVETRTIDALVARGAPVADILRLYPFLEERDVREAADLEWQLARNLRAVA